MLRIAIALVAGCAASPAQPPGGDAGPAAAARTGAPDGGVPDASVVIGVCDPETQDCAAEVERQMEAERLARCMDTYRREHDNCIDLEERFARAMCDRGVRLGGSRISNPGDAEKWRCREERRVGRPRREWGMADGMTFEPAVPGYEWECAERARKKAGCEPL